MATLAAWSVQQPINTNALPEKLSEVVTEVMPSETLSDVERTEE